MTKREATDEERDIANKFKSEGNQLMKDKKFKGDNSERVNFLMIIQRPSKDTLKLSMCKKVQFTTATEPPLTDVFQKLSSRSRRFLKIDDSALRDASDLQALPNKAPYRSILARCGLVRSVQLRSLARAFWRELEHASPRTFQIEARSQ